MDFVEDEDGQTDIKAVQPPDVMVLPPATPEDAAECDREDVVGNVSSDLDENTDEADSEVFEVEFDSFREENEPEDGGGVWNTTATEATSSLAAGL